MALATTPTSAMTPPPSAQAMAVGSGRGGSLGLAGAPLSPTLVGDASSESPLKGMNGIQRAAALLIALGPEASSVIFKHLNETDVEAVTVELFRMRQVSARVTEAVIEDVYDTLVASDYMETGGLEYAQQLITRTFGAERGQELINRIAQRVKKGPFDFLREIDPSQLVSFLAPEHPQTVALVLSHLRPEQAAMVLTALTPEMQADIATRIATMDRTQPEVIREVDRLLKQKLSNIGATNTELVGGVKHLVSVLNASDTASQKAIVEVLDEQQPELAEEIKKNMFVFEDINSLSDRDLQRLARELDTKELALALRGASDNLANRIITKGMSIRAGQSLRDDMEIMGPQRVSAIEEAQQKVVAVVRRLEQAEEITISRGGSDDLK
jgi:flagellar motor switch protein FliG